MSRTLRSPLTILFFLFTTLLLGQVQLGNGSYTASFPGVDVAGRNGFPSGTPQLSGAAVGKPVPTNDWWSKLVKDDQADNLFNYPMTMRTTSTGLVVTYIPWGVIGDSAPIEVSLSGLQTSRTTVSDFSDWTVTMNWKDADNELSVTSGIGMPFLYFEKEANDVVEVKVNGGTASINQEMLIIENASYEADFVFYAPTGSSWTQSGNTYTSTMDNKTYWSMAMLPQSTANVAQMADSFKQHAYVFPSNTSTSWSYNESNSVMTTVFTVTPEVKEGSNSNVLQGLLPHQWGHLSSGSASPNFETYSSVRGDLKMMQGNSFTVENTFSGILPTLPFLSPYSATFDPAELDEKIRQIEDNQLDLWTDSYNEGQLMNRLIQTARIAHEMGNTTSTDKIVNTIKNRLEDWLTYSSGEVAFLFYYNSDWSAMLGYPAGHGQDTNINDHHFHWGYFIHAASFLEQFEPGWADQWGPMINRLIRDAASQDRNDSEFPFLRNFSPFAGHCWANGFASFPQGNDQESTSESMQFNSSLIHWGTLTGQDDIRDLGIYLYTTEQTAIEEYWFDVSERNFQPNQTYGLVSRVWGNSYDNGTFWTSDITASYGIELYPIHGGSFYLAKDKDYVNKIWSEIENYTEILNPNSDNPNLWYDTFWKYLAQIDPARAIELYDLSPDRTLKFGVSDAQTYHWLHALNAMGTVVPEITANYPIASVFEKDGVKTYVAHNYSNAAIDVQFSDGFVLQAPANQLTTNRSLNIQATLSSSFEQAYANGKVNLALSVQSGQADRVEFFEGETLLGTDTEAPYEFLTDNLEIGKRNFYARIYVGEAFEISNIVSVQVGEQLPYNGQIHSLPGTIEAGHYDVFEGGLGQGIAYLDISKGNNGDFRPEEDVDAAVVQGEGATIGWISGGEWVEYSISVTESGLYDVAFRYASGNSAGGGPFQLELDGTPISNAVSVPTTGAWESFATQTIADIALPKGEHILRIAFSSGEFNLGRLTFSRTADLPYDVPLAEAGSNQTVVLPNSTANLDGSGTEYNGTDALTYTWTQLYGPSLVSFDNANAQSPQISNLIEGVYKIQLLVDDGNYSDTDEVLIIVNQTGNSVPSVSLLTPADGSAFRENEAIFLSASASDVDGTIAKVEFYQGTQKLAEVTEAPYEYTWEGGSPGTYDLSAQATDNGGAITISQSNTISINEVKTCVENSSEAQQGQFSIGYISTFETVGNSVTITFELLDTDKPGLVAFLWQESPFQEFPMDQVGAQVFQRTITGLTDGQQLSYACKFAFAGGLSVTKYIQYTVGSDCDGQNDILAPTNFSAQVSEVGATSASFHLQAEDNSGSVVFSLKLGNEERLFSGDSGVLTEASWSGLNPESSYTFLASVKDASGNENGNTISLDATTTESGNNACSGQRADSQQGSFQVGYTYSFSTQGNNVILEFELLDNRSDVIAYIWKENPFQETQMNNSGGKRFSINLPNQTPGESLSYACKFAFAGGLAVTPYLQYTVGDDCSSGSSDSDNDGVPDTEDTCPNTPAGVQVDSSGCELFSLPSNNFLITTTSVSCPGSANGAISISAADTSHTYFVSIPGQGTQSLSSTTQHTANITGLSAGSYEICITVSGVAGYEQCFTVTISEPDPLSASSKFDRESKTVNISLDGGTEYTVELNGSLTKTTDSSLTLSLKSGLNTLKISTDKDCQGVFYKEYFVSEEVLFYPNPVENEAYLYIGGLDQNVDVVLNTPSGETVLQKRLSIPSSRQVRIDLSPYAQGIYFISLKAATVSSKLKIMKQ